MSALQRKLHPIDYRSGALASRNNQSIIDFSNNDYLGYSQDKRLLNEINQIKWTQFGSNGSRLLGGDYIITHELEKLCANLCNKEESLFFNSGYQMNSGILSTLVEKGDLIIADKLSHASLIDGSLKSAAQLMRFKHNDITHLEKLLHTYRNDYNKCLIISETIFSMDGDLCPLQDLIRLKEQFNTELYIDEAHAIGAYGDKGQGLITEKESKKIDYIAGTFGKALGSTGAFIACSKSKKDHFINKCRSFIYSTSLPIPVLTFNKIALKIIKDDHYNRKKLKENSRMARKKLESLPFEIKGNTHIIPIIVGDSKKAQTIQEELLNQNIWVQSIHHPTVPKNQSRLRVSICSHHNDDMIEKLVSNLQNV